MAEVVVCARKPILLKIKLCSWILIVTLVFSFISSSVANASSLNVKAASLDNPYDKSDVFRLNSNNNAQKFSDILLERKPFAITPVESVVIKQEPSPTSPIKFSETIEHYSFPTTTQPPPPPSTEPAAESKITPKPAIYIPGSSLWTAVTKSFFKPKDQLPNPDQNSVFAIPQLKSPRQAWEDLVANAKTGFKGNYEPFQYAHSTTAQPFTVVTQEPNNKGDPEDTSRSPRDSPWHVDTPTLAWDTAKVLWGVNKDLFSHMWKKHVVQQNYHTYDPIKNTLIWPIQEAARFKQGVHKVYKDKVSDLLSLGKFHKDQKVNTLKSLLKPAEIGWPKPVVVNSGWTKPTVVNPGWTAAVPVHHHHVFTDASLIARWIKAKINLKKHLFLTTWRLNAELLKGVPALAKIKINLIRAILNLIANKDATAPFIITKIKINLIRAILNLIANKDATAPFIVAKIFKNAAWNGKKKFLQAIFKLKELKKYPIEYPPITEITYPGKGIGYPVDLTSKNIQQITPPVQQTLPVSYQPPQPQPIVTKYPLYSYPSLPFSEPSQNHHHQYTYATLPPVVTVTGAYDENKGTLVDVPFEVYNGQGKFQAPRGNYDSVSAGSEETPQRQSLFLSKLVKSIEKPAFAETTEKSQSQPNEAEKPRFSLKLLNSGFASS